MVLASRAETTRTEFGEIEFDLSLCDLIHCTFNAYLVKEICHCHFVLFSFVSCVWNYAFGIPPTVKAAIVIYTALKGFSCVHARTRTTARSDIAASEYARLPACFPDVLRHSYHVCKSICIYKAPEEQKRRNYRRVNVDVVERASVLNRTWFLIALFLLHFFLAYAAFIHGYDDVPAAFFSIRWCRWWWWSARIKGCFDLPFIRLFWLPYFTPRV